MNEFMLLGLIPSYGSILIFILATIAPPAKPLNLKHCFHVSKSIHATSISEYTINYRKQILLDTQYATQYLALAYILIQRVCITNSN